MQQRLSDRFAEDGADGTDIVLSSIIEPGGGLEVSENDKLQIVSSSPDTAFILEINASGDDTAERTFTKSGNNTIVSPPFKTYEGTIAYINQKITINIPVTINLTSNVFWGNQAGGKPSNQNPVPIDLRSRGADIRINLNGFTMTGEFNDNFPVEIGMEFSNCTRVILHNGTVVFNGCTRNKSLIRSENSFLVIYDLELIANGERIESFINTITGGTIHAWPGNNYFLKLQANLTEGAYNIFRVRTISSLHIANSTQDHLKDYKYQVIFGGSLFRFTRYVDCKNSGTFIQYGAPITRESSFTGNLYRIGSDIAPQTFYGYLNSIFSTGNTYTLPTDPTPNLQTLVFPGDGISVLDFGAQSNNNPTTSSTGTDASLLPLVIT